MQCISVAAAAVVAVAITAAIATAVAVVAVTAAIAADRKDILMVYIKDYSIKKL